MQICVTIAGTHVCLRGASPLHVSLLRGALVAPAGLLLRLAAWRRVHLLPPLHAIVGGRAGEIARRCWLRLLLLSRVHLLAILRVGLATLKLLLLVVQALPIGHRLCLGRLPSLARGSAMLPRRSRMQVLTIWHLLCLRRLPGECAT